jgi:hypothetical protein
VRKQAKPPFAPNQQATVKRPQDTLATKSTESFSVTKVKPPRKPTAVQATEPTAANAAPTMRPAFKITESAKQVGPAVKAPTYGKQLDRTVTSSPINPPKGQIAEELTRSVRVSKVKRKGK